MAQSDKKTLRPKRQIDIKSSPEGRYVRSDDQLGKGEFKRVYLATDTESACDVAWNVVDLERLREDEQSTVRKETQILNKLGHPNVMNFYYMWEEKEHAQLIFITERLSSTLKKYIKRISPVKLHILQRWCLQILQALEYLHSLDPPVIHRDLKCDNILVDGGGKGDLKLADFGLSISREENSKTMLGTPGFMAFEMFEKNPEYDFKIDIFAFGMCVLEMATNEYPYAAECDRIPGILEKTQKREYPQALDRVQDLNVKSLIKACLKDRIERPTAKQLMEHKFFKCDYKTESIGREILPEKDSKIVRTDQLEGDINVNMHENGLQGDDDSGKPPNYPIDKVKVDRNLEDSSGRSVKLTITKDRKRFTTLFNFDEDTAHSIARELMGSGTSHEEGEEAAEVDDQATFVVVLAEDIKTKLITYRKNWIELQNKAKDDEVEKLLLQLGINTDYSERFSNEEMSVDDIRMLNADELKQLIPKIGPRRRLQNWVEDERKRSGGDVFEPSQSSAPGGPTANPGGEQMPFPPNQYGSLQNPLNPGMLQNGMAGYPIQAPGSTGQAHGQPQYASAGGAGQPQFASGAGGQPQYASGLMPNTPGMMPNTPGMMPGAPQNIGLQRDISVQDPNFRPMYYPMYPGQPGTASATSTPAPAGHQPVGGMMPQQAGVNPQTGAAPNEAQLAQQMYFMQQQSILQQQQQQHQQALAAQSAAAGMTVAASATGSAGGGGMAGAPSDVSGTQQQRPPPPPGVWIQQAPPPGSDTLHPASGIVAEHIAKFERGEERRRKTIPPNLLKQLVQPVSFSKIPQRPEGSSSPSSPSGHYKKS